MTIAADSTKMSEDLQERYPLTVEQTGRFREDGFIKLEDVLSAGVIEHYGRAVTRFTLEHNPLKDKSLDERDIYGKAFIQVGDLSVSNQRV